MTESIVMRRILGLEKEHRIKTTVMLEQELIEKVKQNCLDLSDVMNLALEDFLRKKGYF